MSLKVANTLVNLVMVKHKISDCSYNDVSKGNSNMCSGKSIKKYKDLEVAQASNEKTERICVKLPSTFTKEDFSVDINNCKN